MDSELPLDFSFAFNNKNFSDGALTIEIIADTSDSKSDSIDLNTISPLPRNPKRRRQDLNKDAVDLAVHREEQIVNYNVTDTDGAGAHENQDGDAVAMIEESRSGHEATQTTNSSWSMDCTTLLRVNTIHICSAILAAKSGYFKKLFSNGMRESQQKHVTVRINASEEAAVMDLLKFMYSNTSSSTTPCALLDVLMAADKFEVVSCMRHCCQLLQNSPMTCESALIYLDLPSTISMVDSVQPLKDAAKKFIAARYKDLTKFEEGVMNLPLAGIEALLSSDDLQVASEDCVYDFILKWARIHFPKLEERREILKTHLSRLIHFPYMSCQKLRKVLMCNDFDPELASKDVLEALFFKAKEPYPQRSLAPEREYKYRLVKVVEFGVPRQQCVVYLNLRREECVRLFPTGRLYSQAFQFGGQGFYLLAQCNMDEQRSYHCFGFFFGMQEKKKGPVSFAVDYEFAVRSKPNEDFVSKYKGNYTFTASKAIGYTNMFDIHWTAFMAEDSLYFINGILHLRTELTIRL